MGQLETIVSGAGQARPTRPQPWLPMGIGRLGSQVVIGVVKVAPLTAAAQDRHARPWRQQAP